MKKILAVLLAVLMLAAMVPAVFAENTPGEDAAEPAAVCESLRASECGGLKRLSQSTLRGLMPYVEKIRVSGKETETALMQAVASAFRAAGLTKLALPAGANGAYAPTAEDGAALPQEDYTVEELSRLIRKYLFIEVENPDEVAALIAETCEFDYALIEGGDGTLYIRVDIEHNPEIFNYDVFRKLVEDLYARQNEEMKKDEYGQIDYVMSYEHIAGELALHAIAFAACNEIIRLTNTKNEKILDLYRSAAVADLNVDEARVPSQLIDLIGTLIVNVFKFNVFKLFSFLA